MSLGQRIHDLAATLFACVVVLVAFTSPAFANVCGGEDLIGKLQREQPGKYQEIANKAAETANGDAILWRIEAGSGRAASYLFGTIHLTDERVAKLNDAVKSALDQVDTVALEIVGVGNKQAMLAAIGQRPDLLVLPDGSSLWDLLEPDQRDTVANELVGLGMPRDQAARLKPWLPALMLSLSACEAQRGQAGHPVLDLAVESYAKQRGIRLVGLETPVEQFEAMSSMPLASQALFLADAVKMRGQVDDLNETLIQLYLTRRITWFFPFAQTMGGETNAARRAAEAGFMEALVDKRNVKMAERVAPLLEAGNALIAVGSLHLPGETGLVALLRKQGFEVTPVD